MNFTINNAPNQNFFNNFVVNGNNNNNPFFMNQNRGNVNNNNPFVINQNGMQPLQSPVPQMGFMPPQGFVPQQAPLPPQPGIGTYVPPGPGNPAMFHIPGTGTYNVTRLIANSANKSVYEVFNNTTQKAMVIGLATINNQNYSEIDREMYFHRTFSQLDPNNESFVCGLTAPFEIKGEKKMGFVMPLMKEGDVAKYLKNNPQLTLQQRMAIYSRMLVVVKKMHDLGIRHLDIKVENFLINNNPLKPKISDFGTCSYSDPKSQAAPNDSKLRSPEHQRNNGYNTGRKADIWALGILALEMLGAPKQDLANLSAAVNNGGSDNKINAWVDHLAKNLPSPEAAQLVRSCLQINPDQRPNIDQLIDQVAKSHLC